MSERSRLTTCSGIPCSVLDRKSTRLNSSHSSISYAVFCLKKKKKKKTKRIKQKKKKKTKKIRKQKTKNRKNSKNKKQNNYTQSINDMMNEFSTRYKCYHNI